MSNSVVITCESAAWQVVISMPIITVQRLGDVLECDYSEARGYLEAFEANGMLWSYNHMGEIRHYLTPKGMANWQYGKAYTEYRPCVTLSCVHETVIVCGENMQERHYICDSCHERFDNIRDIPNTRIFL